jgi:hypothetical protein
MYPKKFKDYLIEMAISILWSQWENLGVMANTEKKFKLYSDPEATVIFSEYFSKYEKRFNKIIEKWVTTNGNNLNTVRMKRIVREINKKYKIDISPGYRVTRNEVSDFIIEPDALLPENLLLRLRLIFGRSTKAEVVFHLINNKISNSNKIAKERFLNQKAVLVELNKLMKAGLLIEKRTSRTRIFEISENYTKVLPHSDFYDSSLWLLFVISYIFDKCLKDEYLHDDYIVHSSFNDFRKTISYGLHMAMDCKIQLNTITAEKFYLSVFDYLNCIFEKLGYWRLQR